MIKKAPITMAYQVNLYCDKCGEIMKFGKDFMKNSDGEVNLLYKCECGHTEWHKEQYPNQIIHFDLSREEIVE